MEFHDKIISSTCVSKSADLVMFVSSVINLFFKGQMEYAMRIIISVVEQIFCSWLFHEMIFRVKLVNVAFEGGVIWRRATG